MPKATYHRLHVHHVHVLRQGNDALREQRLDHGQPSLGHVAVPLVHLDHAAHGVRGVLVLRVVGVQVVQLVAGEPVLVGGLRRVHAFEEVRGAGVRLRPDGGDELLYDVLDEVSPVVTDFNVLLIIDIYIQLSDVIFSKMSRNRTYPLPDVGKCFQNLGHK